LTFKVAILTTGTIAFAAWMNFVICIARSELWDGVGNQAFHDEFLNVVEEPGHKLDDFQNKGDGDLRSVVPVLDQVIVHQIGWKTCKLRQNLEQHILKNIWQLGNLAMDVFVPLDKFEMLDDLNCLDTDRVEQGNRISRANVKKGSDCTANVHAKLDNAIHIADLAQTFNGRLQCSAIGFNKVKLTLIFCNLLRLAICIHFPKIALLNEAQNSNGICLVTQRVKHGPLKGATEKSQSKILWNMMHTKPIGHVLGDFAENGLENVDRKDGSDQSGLKENVLHCLSIFCNTWFSERSMDKKSSMPLTRRSWTMLLLDLASVSRV
jgi:hypothetical protein